MVYFYLKQSGTRLLCVNQLILNIQQWSLERVFDIKHLYCWLEAHPDNFMKGISSLNQAKKKNKVVFFANVSIKRNQNNVYITQQCISGELNICDCDQNYFSPFS